MERARVLRSLRYAVTALSLTACVLLVALWVRSYTWNDIMQGSLGHVGFGCDSCKGRCAITLGRKSQAAYWYERDVNSVSIEDGMPFRLGYEHLLLDSFPYVSIPHGFVAIVALIFAAAPWLRASNRFSLRTLLTAITLVAVMLGVAIYLAR